MYYDYHVHTNYSDDSVYPMEKVVKDAIEKGIQEICFTDHVDYGVKVDPEYLNEQTRAAYERNAVQMPERTRYNRQVLETAMEAGHILLENGAEIARVEETMDRISRHFGVNFGDFFVLSNGIFTTGGYEADGQFARVKHIPVQGTQLDKVVEINALSRGIAEGKYESLEAVKERLQEIRRMPGKSKWVQVLASALGSASFSYLFGGNLTDAAAAGAAGFVLYLFIMFVFPAHMSKIVSNILGGAIVTFTCILCYRLGFGDHLNFMIIGSIIPLVPGVPFTNGIRDIGNGDYISGGVRLLDAILVFLCIAIGVGVIFSLYHVLLGGAYL